MASDSQSHEVRSAARGPHWIAWILEPGSEQPRHSIVLVGATKAEAEARASAWAGSIYNLQFTSHTPAG
jgi:hypothetical protein